jgi:hypothetical protein
MPPPTTPPENSGEATPPGDHGPSGLIDVLVGLALDDLAEGNIDIETALRTIARAAWTDGHRHGVSGLQPDS